MRVHEACPFLLVGEGGLTDRWSFSQHASWKRSLSLGILLQFPYYWELTLKEYVLPWRNPSWPHLSQDFKRWTILISIMGLHIGTPIHWWWHNPSGGNFLCLTEIWSIRIHQNFWEFCVPKLQLEVTLAVACIEHYPKNELPSSPNVFFLAKFCITTPWTFHGAGDYSQTKNWRRSPGRPAYYYTYIYIYT